MAGSHEAANSVIDILWGALLVTVMAAGLRYYPSELWVTKMSFFFAQRIDATGERDNFIARETVMTARIGKTMPLGN